MKRGLAAMSSRPIARSTLGRSLGLLTTTVNQRSSPVWKKPEKATMRSFLGWAVVTSP